MFHPYMPEFHGTKTMDGQDYIIMEDLTHGFNHPCIMDVKMGLVTLIVLISSVERWRRCQPRKEGHDGKEGSRLGFLPET